MANNKDRTFRQYVLAQFNNISTSIPKSIKSKGKQADISRISPPISLRLSKSILAK